MVDAAKPPDASRPPLGSADDIREVWDRFRAGGVVPCPTDSSPLALAVDGTMGVYRFVCTRCGLASPWFESGPGGLRVRSHPTPTPGHGGGVDE
jgi:hypothetical protein